ncbi:MAG: hypothetical protein SGJ02_07780 [bacterium]|nr:hypothetical protein [bacterium]
MYPELESWSEDLEMADPLSISEALQQVKFMTAEVHRHLESSKRRLAGFLQNKGPEILLNRETQSVDYYSYLFRVVRENQPWLIDFISPKKE